MRWTHAWTGRQRRRARGRLAIIVALGLVIAACGDSEEATTDAGAGGDTTTATGGGEGGGATEDGAGDSGAQLTGEPIRVMTVAPVDSPLPPYPNIHEAARIYAEYVNDQGGIDGRPLEVILCDERGDPNEAANCARRAAEEDVVALVGSFTFDASRLIPILEEENIAWFGACCPIAANESTSPISFVAGSNAAIPAGAAVKLVQDGCQSPAIVFIDLPIIDVAIEQVENALRSVDFDPEKAKFIRIPVAAQDYSAQVAQAIDGTDCIYGGISDSNWAAFLPAMRALGGDQRLYGHQGNLNSVIAEQFPDLTQCGVAVNSYPNIAAPMWEDYRAALEQYDAPDLDWNSLAGLGTWSAYTAFTELVGQMEGEITNETFLETANSATSVDTGGMVPELDFTTEYTGMGGQFPRVFNRSVAYDLIQDGELQPINDELYDMTTAMDGEPLEEENIPPATECEG